MDPGSAKFGLNEGKTVITQSSMQSHPPPPPGEGPVGPEALVPKGGPFLSGSVLKNAAVPWRWTWPPRAPRVEGPPGALQARM